jgi:Amt family ammonium transporter
MAYNDTTILQTLILWFGWYGFNCGSIITLTVDNHYTVISHTAINLTFSGATACIMSLISSSIAAERSTGETSYYLPYALNGCLSGLVAITAGCAVVTHWASIVIGLIAGALYLVFSKLLVKWKIDDAVDAIPVHVSA